MSLNTIVHMVAARIGISLLPAIAIPTELRDRKGIAVRRFAEPAPARTIGLAWRRSSPHGAAFSQIGALLREVGEAVLALGAERDSTASGGGRTASRNGRSKPR
jgi:LysR family hydrogen peroxide-inducible transcriptional activator